MRPVFSYVEPGYKIACLFLFLLAGIIAAGIITNLILLIPGVGDKDGVTAIYLGSAIQAILATALPAYCLAAFSRDEPLRYLKMNGGKRMGEKLLFAVLAFIGSYFLVSFLTQWNKSMVLPPSMHEVEQVFRSMEDSALATTHVLLSGKTIGRLLLNLSIVAGLAALSEEMFFRGALQQLIEEKFSNGHLAVWLSALVFSIIHFQFYGFLPRLILGALLGYLFLYTRNLWIPILLHFVNNAFIVLLYYGWGGSEWMQRVEEMPVNGLYLLAAVISAVCTVLLFWAYKQRNPEEVEKLRS